MKRFYIIITLLLTLLTFSYWKQSDIQSQYENLKTKNVQLKARITALENTANDYATKEQKQNDLLMANMDIPERVRFVEKENTLLLLPLEGSRILRDVQTNTLAKVIDRAYVDNVTWIYIEIPVHDTPANSRGWIKENDTVPYTKDKVNLVQSDVGIRAGAEVYETFRFEDIKKTIPETLVNGESGRLEEKNNGYCRISMAGGRVVCVKESFVLYPAIN